MMTLIEKDTELQQMLDSIPETAKGTKVRELITKAVEKAYKSGLVRFNAFDHTLEVYEKRSQWVSTDVDFEVGENRTLLNSYLSENGYTT
jgi:hypothetical protein